MPSTSGDAGHSPAAARPSGGLAAGLRWRRLFPGEERQLCRVRRWLASLLPEGHARDDVLTVAVELGTNAVQHTASGRGGWFAVEVTWAGAGVLVAVADSGGPHEPRVASDPLSERGRGLAMVHALSASTGVSGDHRGRIVWAEIPWADGDGTVPPSPEGPYEAAIRHEEDGLGRRLAGVPAWFGCSTLQWWALTGAAGQLVTVPPARELADLLDRGQRAFRAVARGT